MIYGGFRANRLLGWNDFWQKDPLQSAAISSGFYRLQDCMLLFVSMQVNIKDYYPFYVSGYGVYCFPGICCVFNPLFIG